MLDQPRLLFPQRSESVITLEDLDPLQLELEAMLAAAVAKKYSIEEEARVLDNVDKYR